MTEQKTEQVLTGLVADWNLPDGTVVECISTETCYFKIGKHYTITDRRLPTVRGGPLSKVRSTFKVAKKEQVTEQPSPEQTYTGKVSDWGLPVGTVLKCVNCVNCVGSTFTWGLDYLITADYLVGGYSVVDDTFKVAKKDQVTEKTYTGKVSWWDLPDGTVLECVESAGQVFTLGLEYPITDDCFLGGYSVVFGTFKVAKKEQVTEQPSRKTKGENSGGSCDYYRVTINNPTTEEQQPYTAECNDVIEALNMTYAEANIFKEIWRSTAARIGKQKAGHDVVRGAEKIVFFANRNAISKGVK